MCMHQSKQAREFVSRVDFTLSGDDDSCEYIDVAKRINSHEKDLRIIQMNIRGITSKVSDLLYLIDHSFYNETPDVILLCETWLNDNSPPLSIPGYTLFTANRTHKHGGGVAILVAEALQCRRLITTNDNTNQEHCFVELKTATRRFILGSVYRPPNTDPDEFIKWFQTTVDTLKDDSEMIIGLDHNLDLLKSDIHRPTKEFLHTILDLGLMPTITKPTRISHSSATLIDNILINQSENEIYDSYVLQDNTSDHLPCVCILPDVKAAKRDKKTITTRSMKRMNIQRLKEELHNTNWDPILGKCDNLNQKTESVLQLLNDHINHFLPESTKHISYKKLRREPWITSAIMRSIKKSKTLYTQQLHGTDNQKRKYREYNMILKKVKRHAKKQYYIDKCTEYKSNTKQLWKTINKTIGKTNDKTSVISEIIVNAKRINNPRQISNNFCNYFSNVGKQFANKIPSSKKPINDYLKMIRMNKESIFFYPTNEEEIQRIIDKLPNKRSSGYDNIDNILLKEISRGLLGILSTIFNESLREGIFPEVFKLAEVVPLHKGKTTTALDNYRPISLLCTISKILEKIVYKRIYEFLTNTGQITSSQYGFRANHGCDHAIGELLSELVKNMQRKETTACLFLDLSKAFDTLLHNVILQKMEQYGVRGTCLSWMKSYLDKRLMRVKCTTPESSKPIKSETKRVEYGTPQGSCLGPLLFLIFCNDLNLQLQHLRSIQFADDTTVYMGHTNKNYLQFCVEDDLLRLQDWFRANKLTLNAGKTVALIFDSNGTNRKHTKRSNTIDSNQMQLYLDKIKIPILSVTKFLGIWVDDKLNWNSHIDKLETRLRTKLCMLRRGQNLLTTHAKKVLYFAQIHSLLTYGLVIWGSMTSATNLNKIQKLQDKGVQLIAKHRPLEDIYKENKILKVNHLIKLENIKMWFKHHKHQLPARLSQNMNTDQAQHSLEKQHAYNTRNKGIPNLPNTSIKKYKDCFLVQGLRDYQLTPQKIKDSINVKRCTLLTKEWLLNTQ